MKIDAVCLGRAEVLPGLKFRTGINKVPVRGCVMVDADGLVGDRICNRRHHGGPEQAIYVEGAETLRWWQDELGRAVPPGTFGENLVVGDLDNRILAAGDRLVIGEVVLEITSARIPCNTLVAKMEEPSLAKRYSGAARPGAYCRVISGGMVEEGMPVALVPHEGDRIQLCEMLGTFGKRLEGAERQRYLAAPINTRIKDFLT